eukprot:CAMPEP_0197693126 /NCGR_PEP_ID=MMETSP1338-20131121/112043_1 /TAXON_ID=43686 ORGANISM="Pelagodinium beii, Strain RCC1491" /NCGR_SAMPLE_ID=MMETSP1338 /ASSEMBLY_ACC=CAM_ASM_000754 /LENGTH=183 /DNA_ID=CAMNT_0043275839 /DNA_START=18 /DNA_END=569 /DNA_ORIENTATION=+
MRLVAAPSAASCLHRSLGSGGCGGCTFELTTLASCSSKLAELEQSSSAAEEASPTVPSRVSWSSSKIDSSGRTRGLTTCGIVEISGPPHTIPQGPQQPEAQTQFGDRLLSASRKSFRTSPSLGMAFAAAARRSEAGPACPKRKRAAPSRMSALGAFPSIASAAFAQRTTSSCSLRFKQTAAKF